jgi:hypothetical protein
MRPLFSRYSKRAYGEEYLAAPYRRLDRPLDLLEVSALVDDAQRLEQDETRSHLRALRVTTSTGLSTIPAAVKAES